MNSNASIENNHPIDAVIAWVDGSDQRLAEKKKSYLKGKEDSKHPGAHPTRFASLDEIRYCVLSIFRFAPFVRNLFIITDNQDPNLYEDIKTYFPERLNSLRIVDHTEIFEGFEDHLPTFNSISIGNMIWRIKGISENFVYFNDDTFLIRKTEPEDWFKDNRPLLRGKWVAAPVLRILWNTAKKAVNKYLLNHADFQPRASFHMGQWHSASLLGFKFRYFANSHTPHTVELKTIEEFYGRNMQLLVKNITYRFRNYCQHTFISLSNHLQLLHGNRQIIKPELSYMQPYKRSVNYIDEKIKVCENDQRIKFVCVQSLEMCGKESQEKVFRWMDQILDIQPVSQ
ncbi:MAG: Stealth CR1 domain-containing protein [Bacteroidales bacterium]|nr:Stealth CR1 domain-containing protein [Bacteroidales bacterium]